MIEKIKEFKGEFKDYTELRKQENRKNSISMVNGDIVSNNKNSSSGISARVYKNGGWGFASDPIYNDESVKKVIERATRNAEFLSKKNKRKSLKLGSRPGNVEKNFSTDKKKKSQKEKIEFMKEIDNYISNNCDKVSSRTVRISDLDMEKSLITSCNSQSYILRPRSILIISLVINKNGKPVNVYDTFGGLGQFEDHFQNPKDYYDDIDKLYQSLVDKSEGIYPEAGTHECILDSELAGILAHEAIGHTVESDMVRNGSVAADYLNKKVASDLITLIDYANTYNGKICPVPVYIDDEGIMAKDAKIIENGVLKGYMQNKEDAAYLNMESTGNARAYKYSDEPLVRMRNTAIKPGKSKLKDMIASIKDGYYLVKPSNGQADSTSEFMFGIIEGYKIKNGKITKAIKDTTISGVAFDVLKSVSMVSDEMSWTAAGMCGKKQIIPVGMGGPAVKCKINIGGK